MAERINMARDKVVELGDRQKRNSIFIIEVPEVRKTKQWKRISKIII